MASNKSKHLRQKSASDPKTAASDRGSWALWLMPLGALVCCGGPALAGWLASVGLAGVLGVWWTHVGTAGWLALGLLLVALCGGVWYWRVRARRPYRPRPGAAVYPERSR
jgi:hypothetical protein